MGGEMKDLPTSKLIYLMSITRGVLAQSPEPEARDRVFDNNPDRTNWNLEMLVFEERGKSEYPIEEKPLGARMRLPTANSTQTSINI